MARLTDGRAARILGSQRLSLGGARGAPPRRTYRLPLPRLGVAVVAVSLSVLGLAACGSSPSSSGGSKSTSSTTAAPSSNQASSTSAAPSSTASTGSSAAASGSLPSSCSKSSNDVIALSNSYTGNDWRKTMIKTWTQAAKAAEAKGCIKSFKIENTAQNTATQQIAQIQSLILSGVTAINIDSASPTALNSVITQACSKGIKVVVFDSLASAPCEYNLSNNFADMATAQTKGLVKIMGGQGNLLIVRGVVGSQPEKIWYDSQLKVLKNYPKIKVVATVTGMASGPVAEQAVQSVLPSLPTLSAVLGAGGGDGVGIVRAFQNSHKTLPPVTFGNSGQALQIWGQLYKQNGYKAFSNGTVPGVASAALWETVDLLNGAKAIPHSMYLPGISITVKTLPQWQAATPTSNIATWVYTHKEANALIQANIDHSSLPILPPPTKPPTG